MTQNSLYPKVVQLTYETLTNSGRFTPEVEVVEYELRQQKKMFRGHDTNAHIRFLKDSPTEDALDGIAEKMTNGTSADFAEAARRRVREVFEQDVYRKLRNNGHGSAIPKFEWYEAMLQSHAEWAEEYHRDNDVDKSVRELIVGQFVEDIRTFADGDSDIQWLAEQVGEDIDMSWLDAGEPKIIDGEYREEICEIAEAAADDAIEYVSQSATA